MSNPVICHVYPCSPLFNSRWSMDDWLSDWPIQQTTTLRSTICLVRQRICVYPYQPNMFWCSQLVQHVIIAFVELASFFWLNTLLHYLQLIFLSIKISFPWIRLKNSCLVLLCTDSFSFCVFDFFLIHTLLEIFKSKYFSFNTKILILPISTLCSYLCSIHLYFFTRFSFLFDFSHYAMSWYFFYCSKACCLVRPASDINWQFYTNEYKIKVSS